MFIKILPLSYFLLLVVLRFIHYIITLVRVVSRTRYFGIPMHNTNRRLPTLIAAALILGVLFSACTSDLGTIHPPGEVDVDPTFTDFYNTLNGSEELGPAISPKFPYKNMECQYTQAVLMCYDPSATSIDQYSLYALGTALGLRDTPLTTAASTTDRIVDGYILFSDFVPLYDRLYGARYLGRPLTQARTNMTLGRIEQYFENAAFYRSFSDPPGEVHLMAYGSNGCSTSCTYQPPAISVVDLQHSSYPQPFMNTLTAMNGVPDFGEPLTPAYIASDGNLEQTYRNVVIYAPVNQPDAAKLRPIAVAMNFPVAAPGSQQYNENNGVIFYPVQGNLGYHVPLVFRDFIERHGNFSVSGKPLADTSQVNSTTYRQCFENYCLDYITSGDDADSVSMEPLGQEYLTYTPPAQAAPPQFVFSQKSVVIQLSEELPRIKSDAVQQINMTLWNAETQQPIPNMEAQLILEYPDGSQYTGHFPPTASNGFSSVMVPARPSTPNGSVIPYMVCLNVPAAEPICQSASYLIWNVE